MNTYEVKIYVATNWSFFTQADHSKTYTFQSKDTLSVFSKRLARDGFGLFDEKTWIMPGAILEIKRV